MFRWLFEKGALQLIGEVFQGENVHTISGKFVFGDGEITFKSEQKYMLQRKTLASD